MITIFNRYLPENTRVLKACNTLSGIGQTMAKQALDQLGISYNVRLKSLSTLQLNNLTSIVLQNYQVGDELRTFINSNKKRLSSISCYRGYRHNQGLPCRGQRTHGNANTARKLRTSFVLSSQQRTRKPSAQSRNK